MYRASTKDRNWYLRD